MSSAKLQNIKEIAKSITFLPTDNEHTETNLKQNVFIIAPKEILTYTLIKTCTGSVSINYKILKE